MAFGDVILEQKRVIMAESLFLVHALYRENTEVVNFMVITEYKAVDEKATPAITVLMCVYNNENWLMDALNSVLAQTFIDFEFIVINDGSTDGSLDILEKFMETDSRIRLFSKPNMGIADSLNLGIMKARGKWLARIDADDICDPDRLNKQYKLAESSNEVVLVGSYCMEIDELSRPGKVYRCPIVDNKLKYNLIFGKSFFAHSSAFILIAAIKNVGGYRARVPSCDDHDLWLRLVPHGLFCCVSEPLIQYRRHKSQYSHLESGKRQRIEHILTLVAFHVIERGGEDPLSYKKDEFLKFYLWVESNLLASNYFSYLYFVASLKKQLTEFKISYADVRGILVNLLSNFPYTLKLLKGYFLGVRFPIRLAKKWVNERYV